MVFFVLMSAETIQLREAHPQELGEIALVLARANARRDSNPLPADVGDGQTQAMQDRLEKHSPNAWTYVATSGERIVGFAFGYPRINESEPTTPPDTEYLSLLMVEPAYWGRGIAGRLLDLIADKAKAADRSRLTLWTRQEDNEHARGMYEHKGYVPTGLTRNSRYGRQVEYQFEL